MLQIRELEQMVVAVLVRLGLKLNVIEAVFNYLAIKCSVQRELMPA
jgi:hypothetical protein